VHGFSVLNTKPTTQKAGEVKAILVKQRFLVLGRYWKQHQTHPSTPPPQFWSLILITMVLKKLKNQFCYKTAVLENQRTSQIVLLYKTVCSSPALHKIRVQGLCSVKSA